MTIHCMDMAGFHRLRLAAHENARPAGELAAVALQHEFERALAASGLFDRVEMGRTDDSDQMVIGLCRCTREILPWEAGLGVERLWRSVAERFTWEAHTVECTDSIMEFESAATVDDQGHYVTVHVVAEVFAPAAVTQDAPEPAALTTES